MDGSGLGFRISGPDRSFGVVSGKRVGPNQVFAGRLPGSPDLRRIPGQESSSSTTALPWSFGEPEMKRRRRIAKYRVYTVEGKIKASLRKGLRWFKNKCSEIVHGC